MTRSHCDMDASGYMRIWERNGFWALKKGRRKIIVEVKSFVGPSDVKDLEQALGQYVLHRQLIDNVDPERYLYLAVTTGILKSVFEDGLGELLLAKQIVRLLVFDPKSEVVTRWIPD